MLKIARNKMLDVLNLIGKKTAVRFILRLRTDFPEAMAFFEYRYERFNEALIKLYEEWPKLSTRVRFIILIILILVSNTLVIPLITAIMKNLDDLDFLLEAATSLLFGAYCGAKFFFAIFTSQKMLSLLNHIRKDLEIWVQDCDVDILRAYTQKGKKMSFVYLVLCYATSTIFMLAPVIPKIIDVLVRNGTEPGQFPIPVDYYYIDMQKYYFYIILHCFLCASMGSVFPMTYSCMFIILVQHGCGLFSALGRKLQRIRKNENLTEMPNALEKQDINMVNLGWCIDRHHDAIEYAKLIEATYSWCFLFILGINVFGISMSGLQIVKKTVHRQQTIRFAAITLLCTIHLYFDNYLAQMLMDHSISIRYFLLNSEWYKFPLKTQKLLLLMMMRCNVPCKLTAGKITTLSIETFGMFFKTSLSYLTVLRSI